MEISKREELEGIIRKIQDYPAALDIVNDAFDKMFSDLGFKLKPDEKAYIVKKLLSEQKMESPIVCAGTGARCCRY